jgi:hypothetical protein
MTLEEAESLKEGDIIFCAGFNNRVITSCKVISSELHWHEKGSTSDHSWTYKDIILMSKAEPSIINNYQIY